MKGNYIRGGTQKNFYSDTEVENVDCLTCDSSEKKNIHNEFGSIGIVKCKNCGLIYTSPRPLNSEKNYHGDIKTYEKEFEYIFNNTLNHHRDVNYYQEISIIKKFKSFGKLLDVGTNAGRFLYLAVKAGFDGYGVEPSPSLSKLAATKFNLRVDNCTLNETKYENNSFDIITAIDVFEHLNEPKKFLNDCYRLLNDEGVLIIKVPNGNYSHLKLKIAKIMGKKTNKMDIFDSYEHVVHHTKESFIKFIKNNNFYVKKIYAPLPINTPVWTRYLGHYYQYPSPWILDWKKIFFRKIFHIIGRVELYFNTKTHFQPDLLYILKKK